MNRLINSHFFRLGFTRMMIRRQGLSVLMFGFSMSSFFLKSFFDFNSTSQLESVINKGVAVGVGVGGSIVFITTIKRKKLKMKKHKTQKRLSALKKEKKKKLK